MDLSVLIPARNEMFLKQTVEDVLRNRRAKTEIIIVCDGAWPVEPLDQHPNVHLAYLPEPIGQRAACNLAARLSDARYVMKLDAHCAVAPGFDAELITTAAALGENVTQIPRQYNLHVFDWRCESCGARTYQGPTPTACASCKGAGPFERVIVWNWERRLTEAWRFDASLKFEYFGEWKDRCDEEARTAGIARPEIIDTMSCLGACWFLSRKQYWALGGMDEGHGSWGQMGTELACKSWLSGGRMVTNRRTWFSHLFRTQGLDFGFPYPLSGAETEKAREYSRRLWLNDMWTGQRKPLRWLIERFAPLPGWTPEQIAALPSSLGSRAA